jgi:hypothetical protein
MATSDLAAVESTPNPQDPTSSTMDSFAQGDADRVGQWDVCSSDEEGGTEDSMQQPGELLEKVLDPQIIQQLDMDLPRTHPQHPHVQERRALIRDMLIQQAALDHELGYCQGLNFVAASFALASSSESEAHIRFQRFVRQTRDMWLPGFPLLTSGTAHFEKLAKDRSWFRHLKEQGVLTQSYLPQQWMALFATWMPLQTLEGILEFLECQGFAGMLAMSLAILDHIGPMLESMAQEELLVSFSPTGLSAIQSRLPESSDLTEMANAWLRIAAEELGCPIDLEANHSSIKFESKDLFQGGGFLDNIQEGAMDMTLRLMVAGAETGRTVFRF